MRRVKESNKDIRTLAGGNEGRASIVWNRAFANDRSRVFEGIPVMNVGRCFRHFVRDKDGNIVGGKVTGDAVKGAIEAIPKSIVKEISGINFDAGGVM